MKSRTASRITSSLLSIVMVFGIFLGTGIKTQAANTVDDFITRCYKVTFDREPDQDGFNYWKNEITGGKLTGSTVAFDFIFSPEYKDKNTSNDVFVKDLYSMFMGRDPDSEGYDYWLKLLNAGSSREDVFTGFSNSPEFYEVCSDCGITAGYFTNEYPLDQVNNVNLFVERLYKVCLDRIGDQEGQAFWVKGLLKGELQGIECAANYIRSPEYTEKDLASIEYVKNLYRAMMGREFDKSGLSYWLAQEECGLSRDGILWGFAFSPEFSEICARYGIVPGTFKPRSKIAIDKYGSYEEYDSNNKWTKTVINGEDGSLYSIYVPEYDSNGRPSTVKEYDKDNKLTSTMKRTFNDAGRITESTSYNEKGNIQSKTSCTYDSDNLYEIHNVCEIHYEDGTKGVYTTELSGGEITKQTGEFFGAEGFYDVTTTNYKNGHMTDSKSYVNGKLSSESVYYPNSDIQKEYSQYDENGKLTEKRTTSEDGKTTTSYVFENGEKVRHHVITKNPDGSDTEKLYSKDDELLEIREVTHPEEGKTVAKVCAPDGTHQVTTISYSGDSSNPLKEEYYNPSGELLYTELTEVSEDSVKKTRVYPDGTTEVVE